MSVAGPGESATLVWRRPPLARSLRSASELRRGNPVARSLKPVALAACLTLWLGVGCGSGEAPPSEQAAAYSSVVSGSRHLRFREAAEACERITSAEVRGDCYLAAASRAPKRRGGGSWCDQIPEARWAWECHFMAAERQLERADYAGAATSCAAAGEYRNECEVHLWSGPLVKMVREVGGAWSPALDRRAEALLAELRSAWPPVPEEEYWTRYYRSVSIHATVLSLEPCRAAEGPRQHTCEEAVVRVLRRRVTDLRPDAPGAEALCGGEEDETQERPPVVAWEEDPVLDDAVRSLVEGFCARAQNTRPMLRSGAGLP